MNVRYRVELSQAEPDELTAMSSKGIALLLNRGPWRLLCPVVPGSPSPGCRSIQRSNNRGACCDATGRIIAMRGLPGAIARLKKPSPLRKAGLPPVLLRGPRKP
jgi:hypothetical protein